MQEAERPLSSESGLSVPAGRCFCGAVIFEVRFAYPKLRGLY
jgi:hypothetical protein